MIPQPCLKALYKCAVSDVGDTASVVDLLETMGLEKVSGEYKAEISSKDGKEVLALTLSEKISGKDKKVFDNNMKLCAQQMLALIPGVQAVEWTYSIESDRCRGGAGYGISGCGWCKGRTVSTIFVLTANLQRRCTNFCVSRQTRKKSHQKI